MRLILLPLIVCAALGILGPLPSEAAPRPDPEVLVVSDVLAEDKASVRPSPGKPIYYIVIGGQERDLGGSVAGDPPVERKTLLLEIARALASQGYLPTKIGGPIPSIALIYSWGTANAIVHEMQDTDPNTGETTTSNVFLNSREIAALVGAYKTQYKLISSSEADQINDAANNDRYYIFVAALDANALRKKQKVLLWRTRISIDSRRTSLPESMKAMLAKAAPYFGKETELPVFVPEEDRRKAEVKIGEAVVVDKDAPQPAPTPQQQKTGGPRK